MDDLCRYIDRPIAFILRYVQQQARWHFVIVTAVLAAVGCSVSTQYGVKYLVDILSGGKTNDVWLAFLVLVLLIGADNLLWRFGGRVARFSFFPGFGGPRGGPFPY